MKIILSANTSWYIWNFRAELIKRLIAAGNEVIVVSPEDAYSGRFASIGAAWIPLFMRPKSVNPLNELRTLFSYIAAYRRSGGSLALQWTVKPNLYGSMAASLSGIAFVNNVSGLGAAFERKSLLSIIVRGLYRTAFRKSRHVFFQNADDRKHFLETGILPVDKTSILPGSGVDLSRFRPESRRAGPFTFLLVARLLKAKGVEDYIRAAYAVRETAKKPVRFILLGFHDPSDPRMADAAAIARAVEDGVIEFPGQSDDVPHWLRQADCVVLPSYYREGIPRSLLEAAACGKPLIAADSVGTREPVIDGVNGYLCEPSNPADLAKKMLRMIDLSPEVFQNMGRESRALAETRFDEKIVLNAYLVQIK